MTVAPVLAGRYETVHVDGGVRIVTSPLSGSRLVDGTPIAANLCVMNEIGFLRNSDAHTPRQRRVYAVTWVFYALVVVAAVALIKPHPVRMNPAGATYVGIATF